MYAFAFTLELGIISYTYLYPILIIKKYITKFLKYVKSLKYFYCLGRCAILKYIYFFNFFKNIQNLWFT